MRSCEYLETNTPEKDRRTKISRLRNVILKKDGRILSHSDPYLESADLVVVNFEFQKNDKRDVQVHMFKTDDDVLNPVKALAMTVKRVWSYPGSTEDTKLCTLLNPDGSLSSIKSTEVATRLKAVVALIGEDILGFTKDDIGIHSIRSGGAMAMFLSGVNTIIIQQVGRWSSEAFLEYIREQVESFTVGVSQKMLAFEFFFNLNRNTSTRVEEDNENGPESVPYSVNFSQMSLHNDSVQLTRNRVTV